MQASSDTELDVAVQAAVKQELWRRGIISWKLHPAQFAVYLAIIAATTSSYVLEIARRWGKTYLLCVIAMEACLRKPGQRVVYGAPTLKHLEEFVLPTIEKIIADAPPDCRPVWNSSSGHWTFPNGSYIHLFGADDKRKADRGRGPEAALVLFDEAGFTPILRYVLRSVLRPQTLTTGGKMLLGSTPAEEPEHDFTLIAERAEKNGNYARQTIFDNPRLTEAQIKQFIEDDARDEGLPPDEYMLTDDFRREYMAERVVNKLLIVVPEWESARERLIEIIPRPEYFDGMTMLDMGGADPHAVLLGYWHFQKAFFVVERELFLRNGENTQELSEAIKAEEKKLWGVDQYDGALFVGKANPSALLQNLPDWMGAILTKEAPRQPYARWADNNLQMVRDLYQLHGLAFLPTAKDDKQWQVNNLRVMVRSSELRVDPSCVHLDRQLRSTTWANEKRKTYKRKHGEHGDLVDALVYGGRNIDRQRNPFPVGYGRTADQRLTAKAAADGNHGPSAELSRSYLGGSALGRRLLNRGRR